MRMVVPPNRHALPQRQPDVDARFYRVGAPVQRLPYKSPFQGVHGGGELVRRAGKQTFAALAHESHHERLISFGPKKVAPNQ